MNFNGKLNVLFKTLKLKNSTISQISGVDASLISRFRSGERTPKPDSPQLSRLCTALISYCIDNNKLDILNSICGFPADMSESVLLSALTVWLLNNEEIKDPNLDAKSKDLAPGFLKNFNKKLDDVMTLLDISNIQLAKALNVDPSLISRFRNGSRTPSLKNSTIEDMCSYLFDRANRQRQLAPFYELIDINPAYLNNNEKSIIDYFVDWLCEKKEIAEHSAISSFLNNLNYFTSSVMETPTLEEIISDNIKNDPASTYIGIEGFRAALLKLAANALERQTPSTVYMYTDQDLYFVHKDNSFVNKCVSLIIMLIQKGYTVKIIHSMNHTPSDIFFEIEKFLPLHATGKIESYYHTDVQARRFSQSLFVVPDVGAVTASLVIGTEETGEYHYHSGDKVNYYMNQFDVLLKSCKPLIETYTTNIEKDDPLLLTDTFDEEKSLLTLQYSLPLTGMTDELFERILESNHMHGNLNTAANTLFKDRMSLVSADASAPKTEFVPLASISSLPSKETMANTDIQVLLNDPNYLMVPVNMGMAEANGVEQQVYYSREHYIEHIRLLINKIKTLDHYNFVPIDFKTYKTLRLMVVKERCVISCNSKTPSRVFVFNHKIINKPFEEYINTLQSNRFNKTLTKSESVQLLENYIRFW